MEGGFQSRPRYCEGRWNGRGVAGGRHKEQLLSLSIFRKKPPLLTHITKVMLRTLRFEAGWKPQWSDPEMHREESQYGSL